MKTKDEREAKARLINLQSLGTRFGISTSKKNATIRVDRRELGIDDHTVRLETTITAASRSTATRMAAGAALAGPVGLLAGAIVKKGTTAEVGQLVFTDHATGEDVAAAVVEPQHINYAKYYVDLFNGYTTLSSTS